ncbi:tapasin-related protein-like [Latimeria chalumnae]|uniref:tapasin-related protein-like n=1 Tax=Latimeria chalumnae TaxID=7897 RepID=UPI00313D5EEE
MPVSRVICAHRREDAGSETTWWASPVQRRELSVVPGGQLTVLTDPEPVTAHLSTSVHLSCLFKVGKPQVELAYLAVQWFFNGKKVAEYRDEVHIYSPGVAISEQGLKDGNASLLLTDVRITHEGDYVCNILYTPDMKARTVTLKVKAPPGLSVPDPLVTENEASELICNIDGYYPELISVWWLRDGVLLHGSQRNTTRKNEDETFNTTSTYTLTPTDKDKNIWYACRVNHTALMEALQTKFTLEFKLQVVGGTQAVTALTCLDHFYLMLVKRWRLWA